MTWLVCRWPDGGSLSWSCDHGLLHAYERIAALITEFNLPHDGTWFCKEGHR